MAPMGRLAYGHKMNIGPLDHRGVIEYPVSTQESVYGTETITWTLLAVVWCNVEDGAPSRSESVKLGLNVARDQTTVRYRYRTDVNSAMRITIRGPVDRVLQIVGGPAELGRHEYSEVTCEEFSS